MQCFIYLRHINCDMEREDLLVKAWGLQVLDLDDVEEFGNGVRMEMGSSGRGLLLLCMGIGRGHMSISGGLGQRWDLQVWDWSLQV